MTQEVFVVKIYRSNDGNRGCQNIRGVKTASESHLENCNVDSLLCEIFHGHGGDALEVGWVSAQVAIGEELLDGLVDWREYGGKIFVADFFPVDTDAFVYFFKMRRSVEGGPETG